MTNRCEVEEANSRLPLRRTCHDLALGGLSQRQTLTCLGLSLLAGPLDIDLRYMPWEHQ